MIGVQAERDIRVHCTQTQHEQHAHGGIEDDAEHILS
jgi:hypothetical protein